MINSSIRKYDPEKLEFGGLCICYCSLIVKFSNICDCDVLIKLKILQLS